MRTSLVLDLDSIHILFNFSPRRRTNQREDRSSLSRKIKENVNGVKVKHKRSSHDHNIYEFTFYHFACIWKMCAFTMFHPYKSCSLILPLPICPLFCSLWNFVQSD